MIQRLRNSWNMLEQSVAVLAQNPKLLLFPMVTFCATVMIVLFFLSTFLLQPTGHSYKDKAHWKAVAASVFTQESLDRAAVEPRAGRRSEPVLNNNGLLIAAVLYFFSMFLATFFNVGFYHEIIEALNGRPVGIRQGFVFALSKLRLILFWSLLAGAVGYLIKQLEHRFGFFGKIMMNLIGLVWSVASIFAIPVIVCERGVSGPIAVLKSSAASIKKTWGETLIGFAGLQLGALFGILLSVAPLVGLMALGVKMQSPVIMAVAGTSWFIFIVSFTYFTSVASNVYHCALYVFASTGQPPAGYTRDMMDFAWRHKKA